MTTEVVLVVGENIPWFGVFVGRRYLHLRNGFDSSARAQVHPRRAQRLVPGADGVARRKGIVSGLGFVFIAATTSAILVAPMSLATQSPDEHRVLLVGAS